MYISTAYTALGYETELTDGDKRTEIASGGNHRMCSESRLRPSEGPWDINDSRMAITEVKAMALIAHKDALQEHPDASDAGCTKDADGQDEELAVLGIPNGMRSKAKAKFKAEERRKGFIRAARWGGLNLMAKHL